MSRFVSSAGARSGMVPPSARGRGYADGLAAPGPSATLIMRPLCQVRSALPGASIAVLRASIRGRLLVDWYNMASEQKRRPEMGCG